jgi:hypothetical protein
MADTWIDSAWHVLKIRSRNAALRVQRLKLIFSVQPFNQIFFVGQSKPNFRRIASRVDIILIIIFVGFWIFFDKLLERQARRLSSLDTVRSYVGSKIASHDKPCSRSPRYLENAKTLFCICNRNARPAWKLAAHPPVFGRKDTTYLLRFFARALAFLAARARARILPNNFLSFGAILICQLL